MLACRRGSSGVAGFLGPPFSPGATSATCPRLRGARYSPPKRTTGGVDWEGSVHADLATIWIKVAYTLPSSALAFLPTHHPKVAKK